MIRSIFFAALATAPAFQACAAPMAYNCDTPADRYSAVKVPVNIAALKMSGTITADAFRKGKFWPVGNVILDDKEGNAVWIGLVATKDRTMSDILVQITKAKKSVKRKLGQLPIGQPLNFSIDASKPGKVKFAVNELEVDVTVDSEVSAEAFLSISCSTGEFNFSNLEWSDK